MTGVVESICVSLKKGEKKTPVPEVCVASNHGLEGDAHAGKWHRQVSLLAASDVEAMRSRGIPDLSPGDFAENLVVSGIDFAPLGLGSRLKLGDDIELVVTQIGKECHSRCAIYEQTGDCIMPRVGLFARVVTGGKLKTGDEARVLDVVPRDRFQAVVLTISDRCARGETVDTAGPAVSKLLRTSIDVHIHRERVLADEQAQLEESLRHYSDGHSIDLVVCVGGTGFATRDITPEAVATVIERPTPGLDEAMRTASSAITPHAMLSRAKSGIRRQTLIVSLPGSERGATENLQAILPALPHGLKKLRGDPSDCGRPGAAGHA